VIRKDKKKEKKIKKKIKSQKSKLKSSPPMMNERKLLNTEESVIIDLSGIEKTGSIDSTTITTTGKKPQFSFAGLRQSGPTYRSPNPYTSSDPERPYGAYNENDSYPHYVSTFGRSSGAALEGHQTKSDDQKSRGAF
jgi:hypothetical protein